jgi:hypothetical protein
VPSDLPLPEMVKIERLFYPLDIDHIISHKQLIIKDIMIFRHIYSGLSIKDISDFFDSQAITWRFPKALELMILV